MIRCSDKCGRRRRDTTWATGGRVRVLGGRLKEGRRINPMIRHLDQCGRRCRRWATGEPVWVLADEAAFGHSTPQMIAELGAQVHLASKSEPDTP